MSKTKPRSFIAQILSGTSEFCGMGMAIGRDRVLTCAHVVNLAIGRELRDDSRPRKDQQVNVRFPIPGGHYGHKAIVEKWSPPNESAPVSDYCVLALSAPIPEDVEFAYFRDATRNAQFEAARSDAEDTPLEWRSGVVTSSTSASLYQVESADSEHKEHGFIESGYSGGPAICTKTGDVLGMIVRANPRDKIAQIIPTQKLAQVCGLRKRGIGRREILATLLGVSAIGLGGWWTFSPTRITLPWKPWVGYAPFRVAQELGLYQDLQVDFEDVSTVRDMKHGMNKGKFPIAMWLACTHGIFTSDTHKVDAKVVLKLDESKQGDGIVVSPSIKNPKDLEGKKVALQRDDAGEYLFRRYCKEHGIDYDSLVDRKDSVSPKQAALNFRNGDVQAASTYEPYLGELIRELPGTKTTYMSSELGDFGIVDVLVVQTDYLLEEEPAIKALISGWFEAVELLKRKDTRALELAAESLRISAEMPEYSAADFINDTHEDVVKLSNRADNCEFFDGKEHSTFAKHYKNGLKVFEADNPRSVAEVDGSKLLLSNFCKMGGNK